MQGLAPLHPYLFALNYKALKECSKDFTKHVEDSIYLQEQDEAFRKEKKLSARPEPVPLAKVRIPSSLRNGYIVDAGEE